MEVIELPDSAPAGKWVDILTGKPIELANVRRLSVRVPALAASALPGVVWRREVASRRYLTGMPALWSTFPFVQPPIPVGE